jgi:hypothetical protein
MNNNQVTYDLLVQDLLKDEHLINTLNEILGVSRM